MNELVVVGNLEYGWVVKMLVDDDKHLNVWVENNYSAPPREIDTGQSGLEDLAFRFTTLQIEEGAE